MTTKSRFPQVSAVEREICADAKAVKLRLRFDRVVQRLSGELKATLSGGVTPGHCVVITVSAPIRQPARTAEALKAIVRGGMPHGEVKDTLHGNAARIRVVSPVAPDKPLVLVFVHSPEADARLILDIAAARLAEP